MFRIEGVLFKIEGIVRPTLQEREALKLATPAQLRQGIEYQQDILRIIARDRDQFLSLAVNEAREITQQNIADLEAELAKRSA